MIAVGRNESDGDKRLGCVRLQAEALVGAEDKKIIKTTLLLIRKTRFVKERGFAPRLLDRACDLFFLLCD